MRTMGYMPTEMELTELGQQIRMNCKGGGGMAGGEAGEAGGRVRKLTQSWGYKGRKTPSLEETALVHWGRQHRKWLKGRLSEVGLGSSLPSVSYSAWPWRVMWRQ